MDSSDLDLLLSAALEAKAAKAQASKPPKPATPSPAKIPDSNTIAAQIESELAWETTGITCLSRIQHCDCGSDFHSQDGLFYDQTNRITKARRLTRILFFPQWTKPHPHQHETIEENISLCVHCISDRSLGDSLLSAIDNTSTATNVQLSLFPEHPNRKLRRVA